MAAWTTPTMIGARIGRDLSIVDQEMTGLLIESATGYIAEAAGKDDAWAAALSPVPAVLRGLCIELVVRAMANPGAADSVSETLGSYSYSQSFAGLGVALTEDEVRMVRRVVYPGEVASSEAETSIEQALIDLGAHSARLSLTDLGPDDPAFYIGA